MWITQCSGNQEFLVWSHIFHIYFLPLGLELMRMQTEHLSSPSVQLGKQIDSCTLCRLIPEPHAFSMVLQPLHLMPLWYLVLEIHLTGFRHSRLQSIALCWFWSVIGYASSASYPFPLENIPLNSFLTCCLNQFHFFFHSPSLPKFGNFFKNVFCPFAF